MATRLIQNRLRLSLLMSLGLGALSYQVLLSIERDGAIYVPLINDAPLQLSLTDRSPVAIRVVLPLAAQDVSRRLGVVSTVVRAIGLHLAGPAAHQQSDNRFRRKPRRAA